MKSNIVFAVADISCVVKACWKSQQRDCQQPAIRMVLQQVTIEFINVIIQNESLTREMFIIVYPVHQVV